MGNYNSSRRNGRPNNGGGRRNNNRRRSNYKRPTSQLNPQRFIKTARPVEHASYEPTRTFADFDLHPTLKSNLVQRGYELPTQIQDKAIDHILNQKDVIGIASTGTGKTAAFLLPTQHKLINNRGQKVLVIAPTRELALQIREESREFGRGSKLFDTLLIGGTSIGRQIAELRRHPEIIIGTPGRIKDHIERGTLKLNDVSTVVLDEVDRMLDMGFVNDIRSILSELPNNRQSLFFSATINNTIERLIDNFSNEPIMIMTKTADTSDNVEQTVQYYKHKDEKMDKLHDLLISEQVTKSIVFAETKRSVEKLKTELANRGFKTDAMHGNKSQNQRQRALRNFREDSVEILVATDVASRGIDVVGVSHVINFDVPQTYDDYTHRVGRAGRGDDIGYAVTFVSQR